MKRILSLTLALLMLFSMCISFASCSKEEKMLYTEDTTLGNGSKTITFTVEHIDGFKVVFTIKTDKAIGIITPHLLFFGVSSTTSCAEELSISVVFVKLAIIFYSSVLISAFERIRFFGSVGFLVKYS